MSRSTALRRFMLIGTLLPWLAACGGGGGGSATTAPSTAAVPTLAIVAAKLFRFTWTDVSEATFYRLLENPDGASGFTQVGADISQGVQTVSITVPLYNRANARYLLQSCNATGCTDSTAVAVSGTLLAGIGYFKAANTGVADQFGSAVALSADGSTMVVGSQGEDSNATGITAGTGADGADTSPDSGAVYVFTRSGNTWAQQAYVKSSNSETLDVFGRTVSLSDDGNTLAVGAIGEDSDGSNQADNSQAAAGAVYIYTRSGTIWSQQAYIKAANAEIDDQFGFSISLSTDGNTLAVGTFSEDSNATGVTNGTGTAGVNDGSADNSGAAYVYTRSGTTWTQQAYIKASNAGAGDSFGGSIALSGDGNTLLVGAEEEDGDGAPLPANDGTTDSGAVYIFTRTGTTWSQSAYLKAANVGMSDRYGSVVSINSNGTTIAVGAPREDSATAGVINGTTTPAGADVDANQDHGAIYVYTGGGTNWTQQAYLKPLVTDASDTFGVPVSLSADGNTLAAGASGTAGAEGEDSDADGINGDSGDGAASGAGAAYVFTRSGGNWSQTAYVKAGNSDTDDRFGSVVLSDDGATLAVGAREEDSSAVGVNGDQSDNTAGNSGAVYLY